MPPLHPALVHFPVALALTSVACDTLGKILALSDLVAVGQWTILFAAVASVVAALAGQRDMRLDKLKPATHAVVHLHQMLGWIRSSQPRPACCIAVGPRCTGPNLPRLWVVCSNSCACPSVARR